MAELREGPVPDLPVPRLPSDLRGILDTVAPIFQVEGFSRSTIADLARRLQVPESQLHRLAPTYDDLVLLVVRDFLAQARLRIQFRVAGANGPRAKLVAYLVALSVELGVIQDPFYADLLNHEPANALFREDTVRTTQQVHALVARGVASGDLRRVNPRFVSDVLAAVISAIHRGEIEATAGLDNSSSYAMLADLVLQGVDGDSTHELLAH